MLGARGRELERVVYSSLSYHPVGPQVPRGYLLAEASLHVGEGDGHPWPLVAARRRDEYGGVLDRQANRVVQGLEAAMCWVEASNSAGEKTWKIFLVGPLVAFLGPHQLLGASLLWRGACSGGWLNGPVWPG